MVEAWFARKGLAAELTRKTDRVQSAKAFLTKVDTGFVKKKCDNKQIQHFSQKWIPVL